MIEQRKHFAFETTGAGQGHIRTLERCRDVGYEISLAFLYLLSAEVAIDPVKLRVSQGGHDVPEPDIIRRYNKGIKMFFTRYVPLADKVEIYDNSYGDTRLIADNCLDKSWRVYNRQFGKKFRKKSMKDGQEPIPSIHDVLGPALHKAFLRAADLAKQTRTYLVVQEGDRINKACFL